MGTRPELKQYLEYVVNAGGNATVETFDEDYDPIGPQVRLELIPRFVRVNEDGKLELTAEGLAQIDA